MHEMPYIILYNILYKTPILYKEDMLTIKKLWWNGSADKGARGTSLVTWVQSLEPT